MYIRMNAKSLTARERKRFVDAVLVLKRKGCYESLTMGRCLTVTLVAVAMLLTPSRGEARQQLLEYAGIPWYASEQQVATKFSDARCGAVTDSPLRELNDRYCYRESWLDAVRAREMFWFHKGVLSSISVSFPRESFAKVRAFFVRQYGPPVNADSWEGEMARFILTADEGRFVTHEEGLRFWRRTEEIGMRSDPRRGPKARLPNAQGLSSFVLAIPPWDSTTTVFVTIALEKQPEQRSLWERWLVARFAPDGKIHSPSLIRDDLPLELWEEDSMHETASACEEKRAEHRRKGLIGFSHPMLARYLGVRCVPAAVWFSLPAPNTK